MSEENTKGTKIITQKGTRLVIKHHGGGFVIVVQYTHEGKWYNDTESGVCIEKDNLDEVITALKELQNEFER